MTRRHETASPGPAPTLSDERRSDGYGSFRENNAPTTKPTKQNTRALAPDLLRGLLMLIMALDHTALALNTWEHGTGRTTEMDGAVVSQWNRPVAVVVRSLTHLCAPGFTFLLGVGVVYLGRSRSRLGWSSWRIAKYFAVRGLVLALINIAIGLLVSGGQIWLLNFVLFSLAVDYFLAGMVWVVVDTTEPLLAEAISGLLQDNGTKNGEDVQEPLLRPTREWEESSVSARAATWSWHIHNTILAVFGVVSIWWNIWLSPDNGECRVQSEHTVISLGFTTADGPPMPKSPAVSTNPLFGIWFWIVQSPRVVSVFPPMAWLSFAILGLLYARINLARSWTPRTVALGQSLVGVIFFIFFVLTRILHFGNLSEGCLQTPEHLKHPDRNPYLVSVQSFFYIIKYPPDVAFWALTLSGTFFLLALFGGIPTHISKRFTMLLDFGRAALFFYIAHLLLIFIIGTLMIRWFGHDTGIPNANDPGSTMGIDNAWAYFAIWSCLMLLLWPLTRWYSRFKATKPADSIWRFF